LTSPSRRSKRERGLLNLSVAGCGNFARGVLLYHALRLGFVRPRGVFDLRGDIALAQAKSIGADMATTDFESLLDDASTSAIAVTTDHGTHAYFATEGLLAGKAVHLEKPAALTQPEFIQLLKTLRETGGTLTTGYNRPHSPAYRWFRRHFRDMGLPISVTCVVKGYQLPSSHWYYWPNQGTRIAGNLVHWLDLVCRICSPRRPDRVHVVRPNRPPDHVADNLQIALLFDDGSLASILFTSAGSDFYGVQEYIEVRTGDMTARIDNFERVLIEMGSSRCVRRFKRDKGHRATVGEAMKCLLEQRQCEDTIDAMIRSTAVQLAAQEAFRTGEGTSVDLDVLYQEWGGKALKKGLDRKARM
jgi:predicted dehydrogenase